MQARFWLFIFLLNVGTLWAQDTLFRCQLPQKGIAHMGEDALKRVYLWKNNQLWCYSSKGDQMWAWQNPLNATITAVDFSNPLKTAIFYQEISKVELLDLHGKYIDEVDFSRYDYVNLSDCILAPDNTFWVYDNVQRCLINVSFSGEILSKSLDFSIITNQKLNIGSIEMGDNMLSVSVNNKELLLFDMRAAFIRKISLPMADEIISVINNEELYYLSSKQLFRKRIQKIDTAPTLQCINPDAELFYISSKPYYLTDNELFSVPFCQ